MTRKTLAACLAAFVAVCFLGMPLAAEEAEPSKSGFHADFLHDFERASEKMKDLAKAMPRDSYTWRLTDEVRSVSEIFMHVASANFYLARDLGVELPADLPEEIEENVTTSAEVRLLYLESVDHVRQAVEKNPDLDKEIELFGRKRSVRSVFMIIAGHTHEHLGQAIAYARAKGVVPPWSRPASEEEG